MKWEYLGPQELTIPDGSFFGQPYTQKTSMWRSKVPGGWLVILMTVITNPNISFYPDPSFLWNGKTPEETPADFLLRPAELTSESDPRQLLRADNPDEKV